jgi:hypothetical protein
MKWIAFEKRFVMTPPPKGVRSAGVRFLAVSVNPLLCIPELG